jgi:hypothetical protein
MAVRITFALYDTLTRSGHAEHPWSYDQDERGRAVRFIAAELTDDAPGLQIVHAYEGYNADGDGDFRRDPSELFVHGDHEISLRGVRLIGTDGPPGKQFGITNAGDVSDWMGATMPVGAVRYRIFSLTMPTFNSMVLTDSLWALGGVDDAATELVHLAAASASEL